MEMLFALTLPALVIALFALGMFELVSARRKHGGRRGTAMSSTGFDILQEALYPSKRYEVEQREHEALVVEDDAEGAPPRSRVDLDKGTAHIHLP
jgi:hypothetical protein